ncbi:hypothetical protein LZ30DRAFT_742440 [Colletotrichum cereale]|nr:hypothetical protein LZ30DRAFT_742440 [Colletotrichum cereale]
MAAIGEHITAVCCHSRRLLKQYVSSTGLDLKDYMNTPTRTTEGLLNVINRQNKEFQSFREKRQTLFQVLSTTCKPLEAVGEALARASKEIFHPGQTTFAAVMYLINAAKDTSACYDSIIDLSGQMQDSMVRPTQSHDSQRLSTGLYDKVFKILVTIFEIFVESRMQQAAELESRRLFEELGSRFSEGATLNSCYFP